MQCECVVDKDDQVTSPCLVHAEYARQVARGRDIKVAADFPYAAAILTFHNRDEHTAKPAMCYPVTRIELLNVFNDRMPETVRVFVVADSGGKHGVWVEVQ